MILRLRYFSFITIILLGSVAFGDGCYIPERAVRKIPEISSQRAVLSWKDGKETLVISSALDSESQKLGWIIPLPAVPESIEKQSPGALKTLNFCIQPKITHDLHGEMAAIILTVILANLTLGTLLFKKKYLVTLLLVLMLMCIWSLLLPAAGTSGYVAVRSNNLSVEKSVAVGSYEISILKASKLADLTVWLAENGFSSLPPTADKIAEEYLSKGWVFAAIKLARGDSGENAPHPIKMQFASKEAVYPLKLTSIAGGSPEFEIFVIADKKASCNIIPEEFCDRFVQENFREGTEHEANAGFTGTESDLTIGHTALQKLMWNDCILTKFAGTIKANNMEADIRFAWIPFTASRQHFYTSSGAFKTAIIYFIGAAGIWMFSSMLIFHKRIKELKGPLWYFGFILLPVFVIFALADFVGYLSMPKLTDSDMHISRSMRNIPSTLQYSITEFLESHEAVLQGSEQEITDAILKYSISPTANEQMRINSITGRSLKQEDSPGNFTVEKLPEEVVVRVYDREGSAFIIKRQIPKK
jgi:hypothetical protein